MTSLDATRDDVMFNLCMKYFCYQFMGADGDNVMSAVGEAGSRSGHFYTCLNLNVGPSPPSTNKQKPTSRLKVPI